MTSEKNNSTADREIVLERLLNAPRELVFQAWTDPKHLINWWGPKGFTNTFHEIDVRTGGVWRFMMHGPDGKDYPNKIVYTEVQKPSRLAYTHSDDEAGEQQFETVVTFEVAEGNKTKLTMRTLFRTKEERDFVIKEVGAIEGGNQTLDKMEAYVATM